MNIQIAIMKWDKIANTIICSWTQEIPARLLLGVADDYVVQLICMQHICHTSVLDKNHLDYDGLLEVTRRWKPIVPTQLTPEYDTLVKVLQNLPQTKLINQWKYNWVLLLWGVTSTEMVINRLLVDIRNI